MNRISKILKYVHYSIWLALLTFILVTGIVPAVAHNSPITTEVASTDASRLLAKGKVAYEVGRLTEAQQYWQQALRYYQQVGNIPSQALTLNYLSLVHQELGEWQQAQKLSNQSIKIIQEIASGKNSNNNIQRITAQAFNTQGSLQLKLGKTEMALDSWQQAEHYYRQGEDQIGLLGSQINQAQALQSLGFYRRAQKVLEKLRTELDSQNDPGLKALGLRSLGNALQITGNLTESQKVLQESLTLIQSLNLAEETSATLFSLGNVARASGNPEKAIAFYQQAADMTSDPLTKVEGNLNQMSLLSTQKQWQKIKQLIPQIQSSLSDLPSSRKAIYAQVNFAKNLINLASQEATFANYEFYSQELLGKTLAQSRQLRDLRGQSYALGTLGYWYEQKQQYPRAKKVTEQALNLATDIEASDIAYQWQWQLGRLLKQQGDIPGAIASETQAVTALQEIRADLVATNPDVQFSFRESVEPIYRDLVQLLLSYNPNQENLLQAREVIESLQLAELENYFREACIDAQPKQIDEIDDSAAVIYPIILPERLAVIVSFPDSPLMYYEQSLPEFEVEKTLDQFLQSLNPIYSNKKRLQLSEQIYDWLIKPSEAELAKHNIETLVFVLDGSLRNLPMTALYDGNQYLVEKYGIALTPGLQLLEPESLNNQELKAVVAGLSKSSQGFAALPGVETEVNEIAQYISSQLLLNEEFTNTGLREQLLKTPSSLLHLATHGQFSSNPEETFIVTWNDQIKVKEFEDLLRAREEIGNAQPIELLVMSACQTASGDKRAALGIAGVAVRSGARSTIATLWSVKDESTVVLMDEFYQQLATASSSTTKAEALRQAQISLIHSSDFNHPFFWSPFVLVGNWL
ncbi:MAG: CHAT domain-containing protein [Xenococcaceae cyanobacterium MO_207.B15]|nr:CHAT domain-containing protein [Xenococcaceae cyanobacterium MO_207.B15]